jgi:hypothetical protein
MTFTAVTAVSPKTQYELLISRMVISQVANFLSLIFSRKNLRDEFVITDLGTNCNYRIFDKDGDGKSTGYGQGHCGG